MFTGQEQKVQQVETCLTSHHQERRVCVVYGLGGAGKTQLVLKVVERTREKWETVLYVDASSVEAIESAMQAFAAANSIGETYEDTIRWLESNHKQWLLVFDNADAPSLQMSRFFPNCNHGSIVITTRLQDMTLLAQGPEADCNVSSLNPEDALVLLLKTARIQNHLLTDIERIAASTLLEVSCDSSDVHANQ